MVGSLILEYPEHRAAAGVLLGLNGQLLAKHAIVFAGGSRLTLAYGEYRVSRDVDFLVADRQGYVNLRALVRETGNRGRR